MQLSKRMQRLASMVTEGHRLADVGTDHGYIPITLVKEKKIPSALAMDVNIGPLARAEAHIQAEGLNTYIETRLSDGLTKLAAGEADTVLIAGMGGMLTVHILEGGEHCLDTVKELILQPQSDIDQVRSYLWEHGFQVIEEDIVLDEGKYYPMLKAVHGRMDEPCEAELKFGRLSIQKSPEVLSRYLKDEMHKTEQILQTLRATGKEDSERFFELHHKFTLMEDTVERL